MNEEYLNYLNSKGITMGCFGPRLTEEEKYEILRKQDEYIENYGKPLSKTVTELIRLVKDSEKRVAVSRRLAKIKKHLKGSKHE